MRLLAEWATPEDFATLFQYFWHRDFPIDRKHVGAKRADWTIHIEIVVRNIADLMGLYARFEATSKVDAVLRNADGKDEIALEWEWDGVKGNELKKLREYKPPGFDSKGVYREGAGVPLRYAVLVTYADTTDAEKANLDDVYKQVSDKWKGSDKEKDAPWPLLLILLDWKKVDWKDPKSLKPMTGREFKNIHMSVFDSSGKRSHLRCAPAFPWNVGGTRWYMQWPQ